VAFQVMLHPNVEGSYKIKFIPEFFWVDSFHLDSDASGLAVFSFGHVLSTFGESLLIMG
jgi:hypothetical protein